MERLGALVQDPRPVEEKQQLVLAEVEDTLVSFLERGATLEADILANVKVLLPPDVSKTLDELIPPPPSSSSSSNGSSVYGGSSSQGGYAAEVVEPLVVYTADAVLENQIGAREPAGTAAVQACMNTRQHAAHAVAAGGPRACTPSVRCAAPRCCPALCCRVRGL